MPESNSVASSRAIAYSGPPSALQVKSAIPSRAVEMAKGTDVEPVAEEVLERMEGMENEAWDQQVT